MSVETFAQERVLERLRAKMPPAVVFRDRRYAEAMTFVDHVVKKLVKRATRAMGVHDSIELSEEEGDLCAQALTQLGFRVTRPLVDRGPRGLKSDTTYILHLV